MPASKRVGVKEEKTYIYCRKCMRTLPEGSFYTCVDHFLDSNGKMSICSDCVADMYLGFYTSNPEMDWVIYKMCKILNVRYDPEALEAMKKHLQTFEEKGTTIKNPFGIYKTKLAACQSTRITDRDINENFTFEEIIEEEKEKLRPNGKTEAELMYFWGESPDLSVDDYAFLEREFSEYQKSNVCDTKTMSNLIKNICYKTLQIRKARIEGKSDSSLLKDLQALMKTAGIDPAKATVANTGKNIETFGKFVEMMEKTGPADYYKDKDLYKDYFGIGKYADIIVERPIKNFMTQSRDFTFFEEDKNDDLFD